uniref:Desmethylyatein synthase n=1 Tax=Sinopodophyllum hexandrum TaxID=93608 RepID=C71CU_SINHE|nr:RecName: Full=Desmethylyatein synthase; AltName: Full=Cytochrome P450 family 71 subfamily CU polypeptide 1 [Sinopodophyllum hexandrum]ALG05134.1 cytochrome P450 family 71 subfamily CU polypeptide 1 [Sinopodophyllum hexandrum]
METFQCLTLFLLFISTVFILKRKFSHKPNLPPSPPKLPILGNFHQLGTLVHRAVTVLAAKYGPLMLLHFGKTPVLIVSSQETAKEIMKTHDLALANRPLTTAARALLYDCTDISFAPYGEYWREMKKMAVLNLLSIKKIQSFRSVREELASDMIKEITRLSKTGAPVDVTNMLYHFSEDLLFRCTLGFKPKGQHKFQKLSRDFLDLVGAFCFNDFFPGMAWMDALTGLNRKLKKGSRELDDFVDELIEERIAMVKDGVEPNEFLDLLLHTHRDTTQEIKLTRDNVKAIILDTFLGGIDLPASVMEWAMAELMRNPSKMKIAQEEVRKVVGNKNKVDEDDVYQMNFLKSAVKETLRLHPPAPLLFARESYTSINVENYIIPPYTSVMINIWHIQRDPKLWDKAEEFIPERFMNSGIDYKSHDYEFIPFGSGRRGCPGMSFGVAAVEFAVANLLYWFDWKFVGDTTPETLDMTEDYCFALFKKKPLHFIPISRSS